MGLNGDYNVGDLDFNYDSSIPDITGYLDLVGYSLVVWSRVVDDIIPGSIPDKTNIFALMAGYPA